MPRERRAQRAEKRGEFNKAAQLRAQQKFVDSHPVGEGCEDCPKHCTAVLCGDKCADECYKQQDSKIYPIKDSYSSDSDDSSVNTGQPKYGGRKTRRKRRKKRRKSRKTRKKTKRRRKRRRKKSKKVRRK